MCPYAEYDSKKQLICKPYHSECLFCVMGNKQRYNEIEGQKRAIEEKEKQRKERRAREREVKYGRT